MAGGSRDHAARAGVGQVGAATMAGFEPSRLRLRPGSATSTSAQRGAELTSTGNIDQGHIVYYRGQQATTCSSLLVEGRRARPAAVRKVTRDVNEDVRDRVRALANTEAFQQSRRERKKVEMRFAHMKRILRR